MFCSCVFTSPSLLQPSYHSALAPLQSELSRQTFFIAHLTNHDAVKDNRLKKKTKTKEITTWINFKQAPLSFFLIAQNCTGTHIYIQNK